MSEDRNYQIIFSPQARKAFQKLPQKVQQRLDAKIILLAENPRPPGVVALQGSLGILRLRVGNYRVIYQVEDERLLVIVIKVAHRRDVYRRIN
ncbi:MAG: type II toxin-antitoxin system RelE/ParE family toxin [Oscillatoria sp. PMC 1068.18]|nr:type II toxin-antitoxin system RelE/ParE family toxin [Oscillatoria sp. PMC 1076.18]MEC4990503.1 type II toxin-antitoxin system RelE/ParE family toxin [Oscillatoria sp. PMC 1068.18]